MPKIKTDSPEYIKAIEDLKTMYPKGSTVFVIQRHRSSSGMQRTIGLVAVVCENGRARYALHPNYSASIVTGHKLRQNPDGLVMTGVGYDAGSDIVSSIASALYGDPRALRKESL